MRNLASYWGSVPEKSVEDRLSGLCFSLLNIFDGTSLGLPAFDLVVRPHPDDKALHIRNGERYYEDGMVINADVHMHEEFYQK
jgi:hypothetical protein